ncbi:hypothetical protein ABGB12_27970 [Actinocorallia sp. B10E7]|uniref:hypothetical protein n=1 Tax=Actinocorallia sp. B10E7 TaxID=3153558 RepID=UPI00325D3E41
MSAQDQREQSDSDGERENTAASSASSKGTRLREFLKTAPGLIAVTVLTTVVGAGATLAFTAATDFFKKRDLAEKPVTISVETNPFKIADFADFGASVVAPPGLRNGGTGPGEGCSGFTDWATAGGGIDAGISRLRVVVEARGDKQVHLVQMRVVIDEATDPADGEILICPSASATSSRALEIDLDNPIGKVNYYNEKGDPFGFVVGKDDSEVFLIEAKTKKHQYKWHLALSTILDGRSQEIRIDNAGRPFETTPWPTSAESWSWDWSHSWLQSQP